METKLDMFFNDLPCCFLKSRLSICTFKNGAQKLVWNLCCMYSLFTSNKIGKKKFNEKKLQVKRSALHRNKSYNFLL